MFYKSCITVAFIDITNILCILYHHFLLSKTCSPPINTPFPPAKQNAIENSKPTLSRLSDICPWRTLPVLSLAGRVFSCCLSKAPSLRSPVKFLSCTTQKKTSSWQLRSKHKTPKRCCSSNQQKSLS